MSHTQAVAETETCGGEDEVPGNPHLQDPPELPVASEGEIYVVLTGHIDGSRPAFLIHNCFDEAVGLDTVTGIATLTDESQIESAGVATTAPYILEPGGYALGMARLE